MQLEKVDKTLYRRRVNLVIGVFVAALAVLSVALGSGLIALFGAEPVAAGEPTGNFKLNLMGVVLALAFCSAVLASLKSKPELREVFYVWQLKQLQNKIYRKHKAIKAAAGQGDARALSVLDFYHRSQQLVYELDDNTLTLSTVARDLDWVTSQVQQRQLDLPPFSPDLIESF